MPSSSGVSRLNRAKKQAQSQRKRPIKKVQKKK